MKNESRRIRACGESVRSVAATLATAAAIACPTAVAAQITEDAPALRPAAVVDLRTADGVDLVGGAWRYHDAGIIEVDHQAPGQDLRPSGEPIRTHDIEPKAGGFDFDDSAWEVLDPASLEGRRGTGRLSFNWYRIRFTIPERIGGFDPTGSTVIFEIVVDDYAEIWVDGRLPVALGQTGGPLIKGWNAPNRVVVARNARPGQTVQLAVFGANGPLSDPPGNFIWIRSATLEFYPPGFGADQRIVQAEIERLDPALDVAIPLDAHVERIGSGFIFTEGPVWSPDGFLLFSDPNADRIYRWSSDGQVSVYRTKSGYAGVDIGEYRQPGSNGLAIDPEGRLAIAEHGRRRIVRQERNGVTTVLADRYEGKRLNSPNDIVYRSDGTLFITDPFFGLPKLAEDPAKELPFSGVYALKDGKLQLLVSDLLGPNGIALSPDEKVLYVGNWDETRKVVMRYDLAPDATISNGRVLFDMTDAPGEDAIDGVKVDRLGNLYVSGPGGLWILSPEGKHLGTIRTPNHVHNMAWGDADGRTLYLCARNELYRVRLNVEGVRTTLAAAAP